MNTSDISSYTTTERTSVLRAARRRGRLPYDRLDRLLIEACESPEQMRDLARSLSRVLIVDADDPDDVLNSLGEPLGGFRGHSESDLFHYYADQVRSIPRLTKPEEHVLARRLEFSRERLRLLLEPSKLPEDMLDQVLDRGINCDKIRAELGDEDPDVAREILATLPCGQRDPVVESICREYARIRGHFVERNLYLVIGMTAAYRTYGVPVMDLIQEGNASLIRAVEKFDWRKNVRFQTYAAFWVRQAIERLITANRGIVRVPNYIQQKMRRLRREGKLPRNQKDMDLRDVSRYFDTSREGAARLMETDRHWYSLDTPLGDDDESFAANLEADDDAEDITTSERRMLGRRLDEVLTRHLTEQERDIIRMRFGLEGTAPRTLDQIGAEMSVSRERIRQMQVRALGKLSRRRLLDELKDFL